MMEHIPTSEEMIALLGAEKYRIWQELCTAIESRYEMERLWNTGGRDWDYEYKYRRGGKTLCGLYARTDCFGFMVIFGKAEREKFESRRDDYCNQILATYDAATTYHDGKWVMFELVDMSIIDDLMKLLLIKRKPNKK